jgi:hypothetical protein
VKGQVFCLRAIETGLAEIFIKREDISNPKCIFVWYNITIMVVIYDETGYKQEMGNRAYEKESQ